MRPLIRAFDAFLRRCLGILPLSSDPDCILRIRITRAARPVVMPGVSIATGAPVLEIHLWNERIPPIPPGGPDLAWARRAQRLFFASLQEAARRLRRDPDLAGIQAVAGVTVLILSPDSLQRSRLMQRLGFTVFPAPSHLGRFGRFWENAYTWAILWTYSPSSLRARRFHDLQRDEFWMARDAFLERFDS
jgi:hypothetical protein